MDRTFLILGGGGMVGMEVARQVLREFSPPEGPARTEALHVSPPGGGSTRQGEGGAQTKRVQEAWTPLADGGRRKAEGPRLILATLTEQEAQQAAELLSAEAPDHIDIVGECGDVFLAEGLCHTPRKTLLDDPAARRQVFDDMLGPLDAAYERSHLANLIRKHRPDVIVDAVNTATAISYQDVAGAAVIAERGVGALLAGEAPDPEEIARDVQALILSIAVPQLVRHATILHRAMLEAGTRLYLKVGTTGTGGMGLNVPYTHSEDRPSAKLLGKTAVGFAHTGLLFLMARTPGGPIVKEVKPGALIGYRAVDHRTIRERGETVWCYRAVREPLGRHLDLKRDPEDFHRHIDLQLPVVDTGENGVFTKGEFEAITELGQMELVTPEEVAAVCLREIAGASTGHDLIAAIDGAVMDPSYRGGVLRSWVLGRLEALERETGTHSVALGQLGPPELSKLLWEAELIALTHRTIPDALLATPGEMSREAMALLEANPGLGDTICSLGTPILEPDGLHLRRGPRIRIPEVPGQTEVELDPGDRDHWAAKGWVDLRIENFDIWQNRFRAIIEARSNKSESGSSSVTAGTSEWDEIRAGAVVAWVLANEMGGFRGV